MEKKKTIDLIYIFRLSRCLLASSDLDCLEEMLKLVSIMSVDTIYLTSSNMNEKMKMQRQKFTMNEGDHLTLLNVYKTFLSNKKTKVSFDMIVVLVGIKSTCLYRNGVKQIKSIDEIYSVLVRYENN